MKPANPLPNVKLRVKVISIFLMLHSENVSVLPKGRRGIFTSRRLSVLREHSRVMCLDDCERPHVLMAISFYKLIVFQTTGTPPTARERRPRKRNHTEGSASPPSDTPPDVCATQLRAR